MYRVPDEAEIRAAAEKLGIRLGPDELPVYRKYLAQQLGALDEFVQSAADEVRPPMLAPRRAPGHRPAADQDPFNVWAWQCRIDGEVAGLLAGKTVSFKDNIPVAGIPMSMGAFPLDGFVPDIDATVVTRVLAAGGTVVGKNTMDGLTGGFGFGGGIGDYGRTPNPHNHDHITGGSSTGSVVAVVTGQVDVAIGGDQGGSIRIPAAMTGAVGLKPTFGLVSHFGIGFGTDQSTDYAGPIARTVEDVGAALQAIAGYDGYDPRQEHDVPQSLDVLSGLDGGVSGLRIGLLDEGFAGADTEVTKLVMAAADVLAAAGAQVSTVSVPAHSAIRQAQSALMLEGARAAFDTGFLGVYARTYYPESLIAAVNRLWIDDTDLLPARTKLNLIAAEFSRRTYYGRAYAKAHNSRPRFARAFDAALQAFDVLVMPTCITTAPRYEAPASRAAALEQNLGVGAGTSSRNTSPYNFTGHPALAVPVGKAGELPVSMQLVGRPFGDALLLRTAYAYEHAVDWDHIIAVGA
jgi:amidase